MYALGLNYTSLGGNYEDNINAVAVSNIVFEAAPPKLGEQGNITIDNGDVYNDVAVGGQWESNVLPPPMSAQEGSPDPMGCCRGSTERRWCSSSR